MKTLKGVCMGKLVNPRSGGGEVLSVTWGKY